MQSLPFPLLFNGLVLSIHYTVMPVCVGLWVLYAVGGCVELVDVSTIPVPHYLPFIHAHVELPQRLHMTYRYTGPTHQCSPFT